jgi:sugar phosphate isomerase/epimerase
LASVTTAAPPIVVVFSAPDAAAELAADATAERAADAADFAADAAAPCGVLLTLEPHPAALIAIAAVPPMASILMRIIPPLR